MTTTRREFVTLGTVGLLGAKQLFAQTVVRVPGTEQGAMPILSVGYWDGLIRGAGAETPTTHIVNAQSGGVDSRFNRAGALVTTYGYFRAPQYRSIPVSLSLIAFYPEIDPATKQKIPFIAWNVVVRPNRVDGSLSSKFVVPVDQNNHIELAIDKHAPQVVGGFGLDATQSLITDRSTIVDLGNAVALRRGFYFIALREKDAEDLPNWNGIHVTELRSTDRVRPDSDGVLVGPDGNAVNFDYIVLLVEPYGVTGGTDRSAADHRG
jgi:hypothetical protein